MRLLAAVTGRWLYAYLLPTRARSQMVLEACSAVALPPDVSAMLCSGGDAAFVSTAVEHFKPGQPPRLLTSEALAEHMGLSPESLRSLMAAEGVSAVKPKHHGFDMDDVLRLERAIAAMPTLDQADELLGWPGLAHELVSMRLLTAITLACGDRVIHLRGLCNLFEGRP